MSLLQTNSPQCPSSFPSSPSPSLFSSSSFRISVARPNSTSRAFISCCLSQSQTAIVNGGVVNRIAERNEIRFGLPSKGRMAADTLDLLKVFCSYFCLVAAEMNGSLRKIAILYLDFLFLSENLFDSENRDIICAILSLFEFMITSCSFFVELLRFFLSVSRYFLIFFSIGIIYLKANSSIELRTR